MCAFEKNIGFQEIFMRLCDFWKKFGCTLIPSAQTEVSSPLFHPSSFFNMVSGSKVDIMYFQPYLTPADSIGEGHSAQNYGFLKFQIILKSEVETPQKMFFDSLNFLGFDSENNDIVFKNATFSNFVFRLNAVGYRVFFNSIPIGSIYYIQNIGCSELESIPIAISYDIDKILAIIQNCENIWCTSWNGDNGKCGVLYRDVMLFSKKEGNDFIDNNSINDLIFKEFENCKNMALNFIDSGFVLQAYISTLKAKYCLDILSIKNYIIFNNKICHNKVLRDLIDACCERYNKNKM